MSILRSDGLFFAAPKAGDSRYDNDGLTYTSTAQVNSAIIASYRYIGLTVNISGTEYWYRDGTADGDLIVKSYNDALSNISDDTGNGLLFGGNVAGDINLTGNSSDTNADIIIIPQGTGTVKAAGSHQANIVDDNDLITKGFADANYAAGLAVAGSNTELQFNDSGSLGASSNLTFASDTLVVNGTQLDSTTLIFTNTGTNSILSSDSASTIELAAGIDGADRTEGAFFSAQTVLSGGIAKTSSGDGGYITFETEGLERLRIDDTGRIITSNYTPSIGNTADIATTGFVDTYMSGFSSVTAAGTDLILIKDVSDSNNFKYVTADSIASLASPSLSGYAQLSEDETITGSWNFPILTVDNLTLNGDTIASDTGSVKIDSLISDEITANTTNGDLTLSGNGTGEINLNSNVNVGGSFVMNINSGIYRNVGTGTLGISGGDGLSIGGNIVLYGDVSGSTYPIEFRENGGSILRYNSSTGDWDVRGKNLSEVNKLESDLIESRTTNTDLTLSGNGTGNVSLSSDLDLESNFIINVADPTSAQDAATKAYVDANAGGGGSNTVNKLVYNKNLTTPQVISVDRTKTLTEELIGVSSVTYETYEPSIDSSWQSQANFAAVVSEIATWASDGLVRVTVGSVDSTGIDFGVVVLEET